MTEPTDRPAARTPRYAMPADVAAEIMILAYCASIAARADDAPSVR